MLDAKTGVYGGDGHDNTAANKQGLPHWFYLLAESSQATNSHRREEHHRHRRYSHHGEKEKHRRLQRFKRLLSFQTVKVSLYVFGEAQDK